METWCVRLHVCVCVGVVVGGGAAETIRDARETER